MKGFTFYNEDRVKRDLPAYVSRLADKQQQQQQGPRGGSGSSPRQGGFDTTRRSSRRGATTAAPRFDTLGILLSRGEGRVLGTVSFVSWLRV